MANVYEMYNCDVVDFDESDGDEMVDTLFEAYREKTDDPQFETGPGVTESSYMDTGETDPSAARAIDLSPTEQDVKPHPSALIINREHEASTHRRKLKGRRPTKIKVELPDSDYDDDTSTSFAEFQNPITDVQSISEIATSDSSLLDQANTTPTNDRPHVCDECGRRFRMKSHLRDHRRIHTGEKPFKCPHCPQTFRQKSNLTPHIERHAKGPKPLYECSLCGANFRLKKAYQKHTKSHLTGRVSPSESVETFDETSGNVADVSQSADDDVTENPANKSHDWELEEEITVSHKDLKSYSERAIIDNKVRMLKSRRTSATSQGDDGATTSGGEQESQIEIKEENSVAGLQRNRWEGEKPWQCEFCLKTFRLRGTLHDHRLIHLNLKPHKCPKCYRGFRQKTHMRAHLLICNKDPEPIFACTVCPEKFRFEAALEYHKRKHADADETSDVVVKQEPGLMESEMNEDNGYSGDVVGDTQRDHSVQQNDKVGQSGEGIDTMLDLKLTPWSCEKSGPKRYICDTCDKRFRTYSHLRDHLLVHAGIKPHKCEVCGRHFRQKTALRSHMATIHSKKTYSCERCGVKYMVKVRFDKHVAKCQFVPREDMLEENSLAVGSDNLPILPEPLSPEFQPKVKRMKLSQAGSPERSQEVKFQGHVADESEFPALNLGFESDSEADFGSVQDVFSNFADKTGDNKTTVVEGKAMSLDDDVIDKDISVTATKIAAGIAINKIGPRWGIREHVPKRSRYRAETATGSSVDLSADKSASALNEDETNEGDLYEASDTTELDSIEQLRDAQFTETNAELSHTEVSDRDASDCETSEYEVEPDIDCVSKLKKKVTNKQVNCEMCHEVFYSRRQLLNHQMMHHLEERTYTCDTCDTCESSYSNLQELEKHCSQKHPDSKRECPDCKAEFPTIWSLERHPCPERTWSCSVCNETFDQRTQLAEHSMVHVSDERYLCLLCDRGFLSEGGLKLHITQIHCNSSKFYCETCDKSFASEALQNLHNRRVHVAKPILKCSFCHKTFKNRYLLKVHERYHTNERNHVCPHCEKRFVKSSDLNSHILTHAARQFACDECGAMFRSIGSLKTHKETRHPLDPERYKCAECGAAFGRELSYRGHLKTHDANRKMYACPICQKEFVDKHYVKQHIRYHTNERNYVCEQCGKAFIRKCDLTSHLPKHSEARPFMCTECGKSFKKEIHLKEHRVCHNPDKHFKCPICNETFPTRAKLKSHSYTHSGEKPKYTCDLCPKTFVSKSYVKFHMLRHNNVRNFSCKECAKTFVRKCDLDNHMFKHNGKRPYTCEFCGNSYRTKHSLSEHQTIHTGEQPFECDVCGKKFRKEEYLKLHSAVHTGIKPHMCEICSASFARASSLIKHRIIHEDVKPYTCALCHKGFSQKTLYDVHLKIHAGIKDHVCRLCGHAFAAKSGLRNHYQYVHSTHKPHKCEFCDKRFAFKTDRRKHMKVHMKDEPNPINLTKPRKNRDDINQEQEHSLILSPGQQNEMLDSSHEILNTSHGEMPKPSPEMLNQRPGEMLKPDHEILNQSHEDLPKLTPHEMLSPGHGVLKADHDVLLDHRSVGYGPPLPDPRLLDPRFQDPRLSDPRLSDPRLSDPRLSDPRLSDPRLSNPRLPDPRFSDPRISDPRLPDPRLPDYLAMHEHYRAYPDVNLAAEYMRNSSMV